MNNTERLDAIRQEATGPDADDYGISADDALWLLALVATLQAEKAESERIADRMKQVAEKASDDVDALFDVIAKVREKHFERQAGLWTGLYIGGTICNECRKDWPCPTVEAFASAPVREDNA